MFCPYCGSNQTEKLANCTICGKSLERIGGESGITCSVCKNGNPEDAFYCWSCGEKFKDKERTDRLSNKPVPSVAGIAAITTENKGELLKYLPKVWIGYIIAIVFLLSEFIPLPSEFSNNNTPVLLFIIFLAGTIYWLICVYRLHYVMKQLAGLKYPISPIKAVGFHFIPIFSLYWIFKWPNEIANFLKKNYNSTMLIPYVPGFIIIAGTLVARYFDSGVGLAINFSGLLWITIALKKVLK